jgi:hypothetical protein
MLAAQLRRLATMSSNMQIDFTKLKPVKKSDDNSPIDFATLKPIEKTSDDKKQES